jgi:excisionase family DNA binding protein
MQKENFSFNDLPQIATEIYKEVVNCKQLLLEIKSGSNADTDQWFDLTGVCEFLSDKPSKATIYSMVHERTIPFHKGPKKLRFLKSEIEAWLKNDKKPLPGPDIPPESYLKIKKGDKK